MNECVNLESSSGIIGFLSAAAGGEVQVVSAAGFVRELRPGDPVYTGDRLVSENGGQLILVMPDGTVRELYLDDTFTVSVQSLSRLVEVDLPVRDFQVLLADLDEGAPGDEALPVDQDARELIAQGIDPDNPQFEELLAAVRGGDDITELLDAPAAGDASASDSIQSAVQFDRIGQRVTPQTDFGVDLVLPAGPEPTADSEPALRATSDPEGPASPPPPLSPAPPPPPSPPPSPSPETPIFGIRIATSGVTANETGGLDTVQGTLSVAFEAGAGTVALSSPGATWNPDNHTLTADNGSWRIVHNLDGTYTFTQLVAIDHPDATDPNDAVDFPITVTAIDSEGNIEIAEFTATVLDDSPVIESIEDLTVLNGPGAYSGSWSHDPGTDGYYLMGPDVEEVAQGINLSLTNLDALSFIVRVERQDHFDEEGGYAGESLRAFMENRNGDEVEYFSLMVKTDGSYDFVLASGNPEETESLVFDSNIGGNPLILYAEQIQPGAETDIRFTARDPLGAGTTVNSSAQGIGVGSGPTNVGGMFIGFGEVLKLEFLVGDGDGDATTTPHLERTVNGAAFTFDLQGGPGGSADIEFRFLDHNGIILATKTVTGIVEGESVVLNAAELDIGAYHGVEIEHVGGDDFRLSSTELTTPLVTEAIELDFSVEVIDGDGDSTSDHFTVTIGAPPAETLDLLLVGSNADDLPGAGIPLVVGVRDGLVGSAGSDLIIGDVGGGSSQGVTLNLILLLDISGSMDETIAFNGGTVTRLQALKDAVANLLNQLGNDNAETVRVHIVGFESRETALATFDIIVNGQLNQQALNDAITAITSLEASGGTNYEAGLQGAIDWVDGGGAATGDHVVNQTIFISDGLPTQYYLGDGASTVAGPGNQFSEVALQHITGTYAGGWQFSIPGLGTFFQPDTFSEVDWLIEHFGPTSAIGINVDNPDYLNALAVVQGGEGEPVSITTAEELSDALAALNPLLALASVGSDEIWAVGGDNIIFGDAPNTDSLAAEYGVDLPSGSGWNVFVALENGQSLVNPGWSRADTIDYILANYEELAQPVLDSDGNYRQGGDDIIYGGSGNDIIFGQVGNDTIHAGEGDNLISGGPGNDTLISGPGRDTFIWYSDDQGTEDAPAVDTLVGFRPGVGGDVLHLSDLLQGEEEGNLDDYLNFSFDGSDTLILVDPDGTGPGGVTQHIVIEGVDLTEGFASNADIIDSLVASQQLVTD